MCVGFFMTACIYVCMYDMHACLCTHMYRYVCMYACRAMCAATGGTASSKASLSSADSMSSLPTLVTPDSSTSMASGPARQHPPLAASSENPFARSSGRKTHKSNLPPAASPAVTVSTPQVPDIVPAADVNPFSRKAGRSTHIRASAKISPAPTPDTSVPSADALPTNTTGHANILVSIPEVTSRSAVKSRSPRSSPHAPSSPTSQNPDLIPVKQSKVCAIL